MTGWLSALAIGHTASAAMPRAVNVGNWSIRPQTSTDPKQIDRCSASFTNPTGVTISLLANRDLTYGLAFSSPGWNFAKGSSFSIALRLGDSEYLRRHAVVAQPNTLEVQLTDSIALFHRLRGGGNLQVLAGALRFDFDLAGSNEALPILYRCIMQNAGTRPGGKASQAGALPIPAWASAADSANRTETAALGSEIIAQTGILGAQPLQRSDSPPGLRGDYAWRAGPIIGTVSVLPPGTEIGILPRALGRSDGTACKGNFFLVSAPDTVDQSAVARVFTSCEISPATVTTYYLGVPRQDGGAYLLATMASGVEIPSAKQLLTEFDERLRGVIMTVLAKQSRAAADAPRQDP